MPSTAVSSRAPSSSIPVASGSAQPRLPVSTRSSGCCGLAGGVQWGDRFGGECTRCGASGRDWEIEFGVFQDSFTVV